jgi:hypothetical protein
MAVLGKGETGRSLCRKGLVDSPEPGRDHRRFGYLVNGHVVFYTYVSHGSGKDLNAKLICHMARQCHLSREQFIALVKCTLSKEAYRQILIDKGIIPGP